MLLLTVIFAILSFLLVGAAALLIIEVIRKLTHTNAVTGKKALFVILCGGAAAAAVSVLFLSFVYYRAEPPARSYIESSEKVTVTKEGYAYFFDGPGEDKALIFYPGALVETESYSQIMYMLAENGVDTFLVDMPFRIAFLGMDRADDIIASHTYKEWYMSGHSLGGMLASEYCVQTKNEISGLVLLAAYPIRKLEGGIPVCLICGSDDLVLSWEKYEDSKALYTGRVDELDIKGGNHAQFGSYGEQIGDGKASVSPDEQKRITADEIIRFVNDHT